MFQISQFQPWGEPAEVQDPNPPPLAKAPYTTPWATEQNSQPRGWTRHPGKGSIQAAARNSESALRSKPLPLPQLQRRFQWDEWFLGPRPERGKHAAAHSEFPNHLVVSPLGGSRTLIQRPLEFTVPALRHVIKQVPASNSGRSFDIDFATVQRSRLGDGPCCNAIDRSTRLMALKKTIAAPQPSSPFSTGRMWRYAQPLSADKQDLARLPSNRPAWSLTDALKNQAQAADGIDLLEHPDPNLLSSETEADSYAGIKSVFRFCWTFLLPIGTTLLCPPLTPAVALLQYACSSPQDQLSTCFVTAAGALLGLPAASPNLLADYALEWGAAESAKHLLFNEDAKAEQPAAAPMPADSVLARVPRPAAVAIATPAPHQTLD